MTVRVVTAEQAARRDLAAIAAGTSSQQLMRRAGEGAARVVSRRFESRADRGSTLIVCGTGNNGGDGWIAAAALERAGCRVFVDSLGEPKTPDAVWARGLTSARPIGSETPDIVVDAVLGTGSRGTPRSEAATAIERIAAYRENGAVVVALDLPSGVDANTGATDRAVAADLTIAMGTVKRGHLLSRDQCGELVAIDIGLPPDGREPDGAPLLIDARWVASRLTRFTAAVHKGNRKRLLVVGATEGMAGAVAYAARGAFRSGVGMVRCCAQGASLLALQTLVPQATVTPWPAPNELASLLEWPHALLIGPGFGVDAEARARAEMWMRAWRGPVVVDADALACFGSDADALGAILDGRPALLTPHAVEAGRLLGTTPTEVMNRRFDVAGELAVKVRATVLLKGVPTVIATPDGAAQSVVARGTPVLAQGGSGDVLSGICATLIAQLGDAHAAACSAAFTHGRAAEIAGAGRPERGVNLDDVVDALGLAWQLDDDPLAEGELAWLPSVGCA